MQQQKRDIPAHYLNKTGILISDAYAYIRPEIRWFYEYWRDKSGASSIPARSDIELLDLTKILSNIWLIDIYDQETLRFKVRLFGTDIVEMSGLDRTGEFMDEGQPGYSDTKGGINMKHVATKAEAVWYCGVPTIVTPKKAGQVEYAIFPLSDDGEIVNKLIGLSFMTYSLN